jgi:hypothetical protein
MIPKTRLAVAVKALPVPLSFVGNISGVYAYKTAYITFEQNEYAQFHPRRALEVCAVVEARMNTPVKRVEADRVPFLPTCLISTRRPPRIAPGTPRTAMIHEFR